MPKSIEITPALADFWDSVLRDGTFTYEDVKERGGPSQPTLTKLTQGSGTISADSARRLEHAIGLEPGSLRSVSEGGTARWKPEGAPGDETMEMVWHDPVTHQHRPVGIVEGYLHSGAWAWTCWKAGASRDLYYEFVDVSVRLYSAALESSGQKSTEAYGKEYTRQSPDSGAGARSDFDLAARAGTIDPSGSLGAQENAGEESQVDPHEV